MKYKVISQAFKANHENIKLYPRFWFNEAKNNPGFKHWSFTIRFIWWYFGIQRKEKK